MLCTTRRCGGLRTAPLPPRSPRTCRMNLPSVFIFNWIFLLALFPVAFFWLRRAYRILVKRDFSEVALKKGVPPPNAEKYAPYEMAINMEKHTSELQSQ